MGSSFRATTVGSVEGHKTGLVSSLLVGGLWEAHFSALGGHERLKWWSDVGVEGGLKGGPRLKSQEMSRDPLRRVPRPPCTLRLSSHNFSRRRGPNPSGSSWAG